MLLEDLQACYAALESGTPIALPEKTTSFKRWSELLAGYAESDALHAELAYWSRLAEAPAPRLPLALPRDAVSLHTTRIAEAQLSERQTADLLTRASAAYRTQIGDILLTALVQAFCAWSGHDRLRVHRAVQQEAADDIDHEQQLEERVALRHGIASRPRRRLRQGQRRLTLRGHGIGADARRLACDALSNREVRAADSDGLRVDTDGNLWCAWSGGEAEDGVAVYAPDGTMIGRIMLPERCANVCFGGQKRNRLFMAASQSIYALYVETQGVLGG